MKAFFNRLHIDKDNPKKKNHTPPPKEKPQLGSLPSWPPQDSSRHHRQPTTTPISVSSRTLTPTQSILHPHPSTPLQEHPAHPYSSLPHPPQDSAPAPRASTSKKPSVSTTSVTSGPNVQKKVAFIVEPPQPSNSNSNSIIRAAPEQQYHHHHPPPQPAASPCPAPASPAAVPSPELSTASTSPSTAAPVKSSVSRFHTTHAVTKEPRGSTSITSNPSSSRVDVFATSKLIKATSVRAVSPFAQSSQPLRLDTPYSSASSSWSEDTEDSDDLVSNLGSRERKRQEVFFEIISSEERYVSELVKMKDTFIGPLLHPQESESSPGAVLGGVFAPHQLLEDLRACLEVIDGGVFEGHKRLQEALRKRYDDQYPLVRSLADVFVSNSDIFAGYAKYVLHLEQALEQAHEALNCDLREAKGKSDNGEYPKVCKLLQRLEAEACDKGETGLAITLSKPFQRLLKYPLFFQNLLLHTDARTYEYESTLQMVAEVEAIARSIQDEKIQEEDRDKTRDVFARIDGLDKVTLVVLPKPSRVLIEERPYVTAAGQSTPPPARDNPSNIRGKSSFKRLSDVLNSGVGGKKDLWLVVFNDVTLQCQRTGTTTLPLVAVTNSRVNSSPDLQGEVKYATTGSRGGRTKPRNLYKFIKIEMGVIGNAVQAGEGVVSVEDIARTRPQLHQPKIVPLPDDDDDDREIDSDDSDKKSKGSFSVWSVPTIATVPKPVGHKARLSPGGVARKGTASPSYSRESSANAKFGTRLVSADLSPSQRPTSRRIHNTVTAGRTRNTEESVRSTVRRPQWNSDGNSRVVVTPIPLKHTGNTSQNSGATTSTRTPIQGMASASVKSLSSPAPSEDSGVGLYRQILAKDPSLDH